jgi:hypothetical protein
MRKFINATALCFVFIALIAMGVTSCKVRKAEPSGSYVGYDYYPLDIGRYVIYDVYDTTYNGIVRSDSLYQLKELIYSSFQEGDEQKYVLHQYFKKTTDAEWPDQPDSVWTLVNTSNQLVRTENNIPYIKLVFPVKDNITWNGNARNIYDAQIYTMKDVDLPYTVSNLSYGQCLKVEISNTKSLVSKDDRYEIYSRGIGPIKKEYTVYSYDQTQLGLDVVDFGYHRVFLMTAYGQD